MYSHSTQMCIQPVSNGLLRCINIRDTSDGELLVSHGMGRQVLITHSSTWHDIKPNKGT